MGNQLAAAGIGQVSAEEHQVAAVVVKQRLRLATGINDFDVMALPDKLGQERSALRHGASDDQQTALCGLHSKQTSGVAPANGT